jgi:hypothetical protein
MDPMIALKSFGSLLLVATCWLLLAAAALDLFFRLAGRQRAALAAPRPASMRAAASASRR